MQHSVFPIVRLSALSGLSFGLGGYLAGSMGDLIIIGVMAQGILGGFALALCTPLPTVRTALKCGYGFFFGTLAGFAGAVMGVPMPTVTDLGLAKGLVETSAYIFSLGGLGYGLAWGSVHSMGYRSFFMGLLGAGCFGVAAIGYALVEPLWIDHNADLIHSQLSSKFFLQGALGGTLLGLAAGVHLHRIQSPQQ